MVTMITYEDHLVLLLDRELFTRGDVCLDRIELVLPDVYQTMESKDIRAVVHLNEQVIVRGEWKGEKLHLDLTNSGLSRKRLVSESGEIRIEFQKQQGTDTEWEPVEGLAYEGDAKAKPLAHVSGAILKRRDSSSSEYATTGYPTTDYPSESSSESSLSEADSSSSENSSDAVSNGRSGMRTASQRARLSAAGLFASLSSGAPQKRYYYLNDGNRNIIALRTPGVGICAMYTYGTYGQCLKTTGTVAEHNPIRYSSEYYDHELDMIYSTTAITIPWMAAGCPAIPWRNRVEQICMDSVPAIPCQEWINWGFSDRRKLDLVVGGISLERKNHGL